MNEPPPKFLRWRLSGALGSRNYRSFITGNTLALIGNWTQRAGGGWVGWELTHSPGWLGLLAFADLFPVLVLGPLAGAIADRHNRLTQVRVCQGLAMCQSLLMAGFSLFGLLDIWLLLALAFSLGVIQSFDQPARLALVGSLVERRDMASAVAINSIAFNLARFLGPVLAGLAIATIGVSFAFTFTALGFLASVILLRRVRIVDDDMPAPSGNGFLSDLWAGLRYTLGHRGLIIALALLTAINAGVRPILELLPAFASQIFTSDASGFAGLGAAIGAGATLGGILMAFRRKGLTLITVALASSAGIVACTLWFSLAGPYWVGVAAIFMLGVFLAASGISMQSLVQLSAEPAMRGRVLSIYGLLFRACPALGGLALGYAAEHFGLRMPTIAAALVVAVVTLWAFLRRHVLVETMEAGIARR